MGFVQVSMSKGSANPDQAGKLREEYEQLARESVEMEIALTNLQYNLPRTALQRFVNPLLIQIRSIERRIAQLIQLLSLLEGAPPTP